MRLCVYGAAGEVTGSCYLLETDRARVLVEFGLHQGGPHAEARNRRLPPIRPADLDAVVVTHAHLDHTGRLPLLTRHGFDGPIFATPATIEMVDILLRDSAHIQLMESERYSRRRARRGRKPIAPLYTLQDVERVLPMFEGLGYQTPRQVAPGVRARYVDAGHILGSASLELTVNEGGRERVIAFSGDLGPRGAPLLADATPFERADLLLLESTYGDRDHRSMDGTLEQFVSILREARTPHGKVLVPSFAVGRTQQLVYFIGQFRREGLVSDPRVAVDSPMAISTTELYRRHRDLFDAEARRIIDAGDTPLDFPGLRFTRSAEDSKALNPLGNGIVILSAAGMCTGGRILHHLRHNLWRPETHVVFVGYQGVGTLGRRIVDGARMVRIMGEPIAVRANIHTLGGFSAHAGQTDLLWWASHLAPARPRTLLIHGEDPQRRTLRERLKADFSLDADLPDFGHVVEL